MKRENFYRRDPSKALSGMIGLTLEERGVYNTLLDLLYSTWRPLEDDRHYIANWCGCAVQKLNPIIRRLIEKGRIITFDEGGRTYLSDEHFEAERSAVKGAGSTRSGRGKVEEKSGEVREKSAGVEENSRVLDTDTSEKQRVKPLEKNREDKSKSSEPIGSAAGPPPDDPDDDLGELRALPIATGCWRLAVKLLVERGGLTDPQARKFVGRLKSGGLGDQDLWSIAEEAWRNGTMDPQPYLARAATQTRQRRGPESVAIMAPGIERQRAWMRDWQAAPNSWREHERGPKPGQPGCRISPGVLREFVVEPAQEAQGQLLPFPPASRSAA